MCVEVDLRVYVASIWPLETLSRKPAQARIRFRADSARVAPMERLGLQLGRAGTGRKIKVKLALWDRLYEPWSKSLTGDLTV